MQKFYLKIEGERWTTRGGPRGRVVHEEEGNGGGLPRRPSAWRSDWTGSWTYSLRPKDSLPETGILTVLGTDWRCHEHDGMRREGREGRNTSRRRAASWPCKENCKIQKKKKQLTKQNKKNSHFRLNWKKISFASSNWNCFFFSQRTAFCIFLHKSTVFFFTLCTVNKYIYNFNLFI